MQYVHDTLKRFPNHHLKLYHSMLQRQEHLEFRYSETLLSFSESFQKMEWHLPNELESTHPNRRLQRKFFSLNEK